jgi:hypothetical protein
MRYPKNGTEDELLVWAGRVLDGINEAEVVALELQGWQIINTVDGRKWPFDGRIKQGWRCPDWCEEYRPAKPKPALRLIEGGRKEEDEM